MGQGQIKPTEAKAEAISDFPVNSEDTDLIKSDPASLKLENSDILKDLHQKLSNLDPVQRKELKQLTRVCFSTKT